MEQQFLVDAALLQAIAEYLAARPFREVRRLIEALEQCQPAVKQQEPKNETNQHDK